MPRKRQTQSGAPAQPMPKVAPQTYGQGVEQQQLNQALPTPNMQVNQHNPATQNAGASAAGAASLGNRIASDTGEAVAATAQQGYDHDAVMAAATQLGPQTGLLNRDSTRPQEPVTAGLSRGPGPGPEALGVVQGTPAGDMLRRLSASTGDPYFAELARKAQA